MRITGRRADGALYLSMGFGLAVILKGQRVTPTLDESVVEGMGPWTPVENSFETRRATQRMLDLAHVAGIEAFLLARAPAPVHSRPTRTRTPPSIVKKITKVKLDDEIPAKDVEDEDVEDEEFDDAEDDAEDDAGDTVDEENDEEEDDDDEKPVDAARAKKGEVVLPAPEDVAVIPEDEEEDAVDAAAKIGEARPQGRAPNTAYATIKKVKPKPTWTSSTSKARSLDDTHDCGCHAKKGEPCGCHASTVNASVASRAAGAALVGARSRKSDAKPETSDEFIARVGKQKEARLAKEAEEKGAADKEAAEEAEYQKWKSDTKDKIKSKVKGFFGIGKKDGGGTGGFDESKHPRGSDTGEFVNAAEKITPASTILLDNAAKFKMLLATTTTAKHLAGGEHPFQYCMDHIIPAMEDEGKGPDDPEAFCAWWKSENA